MKDPWLAMRQGDGTAVCLQNQPAAATISFHAASNFPARKQRSTVDVPLPDGMGDDDFIRCLTSTAHAFE